VSNYADSAITLSVRGRRKIYQSAEKIFELSLHNPVALMAYNNLEYHEIPFEIVVKQFRGSRHCACYDSLFSCADAFLKYLTSSIAIPRNLMDRHVFRIVMEEYTRISEAFQQAVTEEVVKGNIAPDQHLGAFLARVIRSRTEELEGLSPSSCFLNVDHSYIVNMHDEVLSAAIERSFGRAIHGDVEFREALRNVGALFLHRDIFSDKMTGLVFAGFGEKEIFPSLQAVEIDGVIAGHLKQRLIHKIDIDRNVSDDGDTARRRVQIIPFAQTDMAQRFLEGIDPELEEEIVRSIAASNKQVLDKLKENKIGLSEEDMGKVIPVLETYLDEAMKNFQDEAISGHKAELKQEIEDMALMMPKQELAFLAEAIINLTSIKRKVSGDEETVGGPIDVAVISKAEGLVWVRRKHYFDAELNPRYFERIRGAVQQRRRGDSHAEADDGDGLGEATPHDLMPADTGL
jgi:hypothetical protein